MRETLRRALGALVAGVLATTFAAPADASPLDRWTAATLAVEKTSVPETEPDWLPIAAAASSLVVPGTGHLLVGDGTSATWSLGGVVVPVVLTVASVPPYYYFDRTSPISMFGFATQGAWLLQVQQAYQAGRLKTGNTGFPQVLRAQTPWELVTAPFHWDQLSDGRVWLAAGTTLAIAILVPMVATGQNPLPSGPPAFQARSATVYGVPTSPGLALLTDLAGGTAMSLNAGLSEEVLFRGVIQEELERHVGVYPAVATTAIGFGLMHVPQQRTPQAALRSFLVTAAGGAVDGLLYEWSDHDLRKAIAAHTYYDVLIFSLAALYPSTRTQSNFGVRYQF